MATTSIIDRVSAFLTTTNATGTAIWTSPSILTSSAVALHLRMMALRSDNLMVGALVFIGTCVRASGVLTLSWGIQATPDYLAGPSLGAKLAVNGGDATKFDVLVIGSAATTYAWWLDGDVKYFQP